MDLPTPGRYSSFFELVAVREARGAAHCELLLLEPSGAGGQRVFVDCRVARHHIFEAQRFALRLERCRISALHVALYEPDHSLRFVPVWRSLVFEHLAADGPDDRYQAYTDFLRAQIDANVSHGSASFERLVDSIDRDGYDERFPVIVLREQRPEVGRRITHVVDGQHRVATLFHRRGDVVVPSLVLEAVSS